MHVVQQRHPLTVADATAYEFSTIRKKTPKARPTSTWEFSGMRKAAISMGMKKHMPPMADGTPQQVTNLPHMHTLLGGRSEGARGHWMHGEGLGMVGALVACLCHVNISCSRKYLETFPKLLAMVIESTRYLPSM